MVDMVINSCNFFKLLSVAYIKAWSRVRFVIWHKWNPNWFTCKRGSVSLKSNNRTGLKYLYWLQILPWNHFLYLCVYHRHIIELSYAYGVNAKHLVLPPAHRAGRQYEFETSISLSIWYSKVLWFSLNYHFVCIGVAPPRLVTPQALAFWRGEQIKYRRNGSNLI